MIYADSRFQTTRQLFDAYVGAAYVEQGYPNTRAWIQSLVDPDSVSTSVGGSSMGASTDNPPPPTTSPPTPKNSTGAGMFLAKFNETAMRHQVKIAWNAANEGTSPHLPTWRVDCVGKYSRLSDWLIGDAEIFSPSRWNSERYGGRKEQATGERRGCASSIPSLRLGRGRMRSITAVRSQNFTWRWRGTKKGTASNQNVE